MDTIQSKTCTKCGADKPLSEFHIQKAGKHGRSAWCKDCVEQRRRDRTITRRENVPADAKKECTRCREVKPIEDFYLGCGRYGRQQMCRGCVPKKVAKHVENQKKVNRLRRTGFSPQDFDTAINTQENCCAICHGDFSLLPARHIHADHDHRTGERRGVLCQHCNHVLGMANDSAILLRRAAEYLENPPLRGKL